ncbi:hypothetical protein FLAT13_04166 [Flavobacterium salmonis]|uniref:Uncharacterized protein n=1 Tax=Flavobacterium salmonis TaxID=2654844 RepID=A0A6V6Z8A3_9FLAO|nr:hypothetical protein FLAT13_04166 [Flavobacterium salmonis]
MRTKNQLKNKKAELEQWLTDNPNHPDRIKIQSDLNNVINKLLEKEK